MRMSTDHALELERRARDGYPLEVCGAIVGAGEQVHDVIAVENREDREPWHRYRMDPADLVAIQRDARQRGLRILGYYHSHPDHSARPSETDRLVAAAGQSDGVVHVIVSVRRGKATSLGAWVFRAEDEEFGAHDLQVA